jgi:chromosomal replication initiation ATPase DnaA
MLQYEQSLEPGKNPKRGNFNTWIKDTQPLHYEHGKLYLAARNSYAEDWLRDHEFSTEALEALRPSLPDLVEVVITTQTEAP